MNTVYTEGVSCRGEAAIHVYKGVPLYIGVTSGIRKPYIYSYTYMCIYKSQYIMGYPYIYRSILIYVYRGIPIYRGMPI